jgi:ParB-like chromosome segregation protein Spo0J
MNTARRPPRRSSIAIGKINVPDSARPVNDANVAKLAESIKRLGLQVPLTLVERKGRYLLIAGRQRLEALRHLGHNEALAHVVDFDDVEARLWAISENLHRTELSEIERAAQLTEYERLLAVRDNTAVEPPIGGAREKRAQVARVSGGRGKKGGDSQIARDLNLSRDEVRRRRAIDGLSDEAKAAAVEMGLDRNRSALLEAAKAKDPEAQTAALRGVAARRVAPEETRHLANPRAKPLLNLENISAGELARWVKITTPNDRRHVIRVLEEAAGILRQEIEYVHANKEARLGSDQRDRI